METIISLCPPQITPENTWVNSGTRGVSASVTGGFCNVDNELLTQTIGHLFDRLLLLNHKFERLSIIYMLRGCVWWGKHDSTYQVNEVTEVLLDLLRRQTPHQVQSTVELLFSLRQTQIKTQLCCQPLLVLVHLNQTQLCRARNPHHNILGMIFGRNEHGFLEGNEKQFIQPTWFWIVTRDQLRFPCFSSLTGTLSC